MFIVSKSRNETFNLDLTNRIYVKDNSLRIGTEASYGGQLGEYQSYEEAKAALEICLREIELGKKNVYVPTDEEVHACLVNQKSVWHHATGKKTKGHGGS